MNELREIAKDKEYRIKKKTKREGEQTERWLKAARFILSTATAIIGGYSIIVTVIFIVTGAGDAFQLLFNTLTMFMCLLSIRAIFKIIEKNFKGGY